MPEGCALIVDGRICHGSHEDMQGLLLWDTECSQDGRIDLIRQQLAQRDVVAHQISERLVLDLVELQLVLRLAEESLDHVEGLDDLPLCEDHIEVPLPLEVGERDHARARFILAKCEEASVRPLRHHLCTRWEVRAKGFAQDADRRALHQPHLKRLGGTEEVLLGGLLGVTVHGEKLTWRLRGDLFHLFLNRIGRSNPQVHGAQANAVMDKHPVRGLLQELPPLHPAFALWPDVVLRPVHVGEEAEA
mmetsp:Transcript_31345/g.85049  ORF Transcript_31345/g.85049 Transcript_31345/m.85049 type:complete len:247 (+) Transcript_31345:216-956(+)